MNTGQSDCDRHEELSRIARERELTDREADEYFKHVDACRTGRHSIAAVEASAGLPSGAFTHGSAGHGIKSVRQSARELLTIVGVPPPRESDSRTVRACAVLVTASALAIAASAVLFVTVYYPNRTRAELTGSLLSAVAGNDPKQRAVAMTVAQELDPVLAADIKKRLRRWDVNELEAREASSRLMPYAGRIVAGLQKLRLRNADARRIAIWNDLLPALKEAQKNPDDFFVVASECEDILPLLRVNNPGEFVDSYWGELWILNILLDPKMSPVADTARQVAPDPAVVEQVFNRYAPSLQSAERARFEEAVAAYQKTYKSIPNEMKEQ